jgi:hypothetical protein
MRDDLRRLAETDLDEALAYLDYPYYPTKNFILAAMVLFGELCYQEGVKDTEKKSGDA